MQFTIARSALHRALALINHATVRGNTSLPLLAYLRLEVEQDLQQLRLQATNLEISVSVWTPIEEVDTPGVLAVPAKLLTDLVGSLEEGKLTFEIDLDVWKITLVHTKGQAIFMGQSAGEYPSIPLPEAGASVVSIPAMPFARAVRSAGVSLAHDDSKPALACFLLQGAMERLILATTDGRRVSESSVVLAPGQDAGQLGPLLIPGRALAELATVFSDTSFQPQPGALLDAAPGLLCHFAERRVSQLPRSGPAAAPAAGRGEHRRTAAFGAAGAHFHRRRAARRSLFHSTGRRYYARFAHPLNSQRGGQHVY